MDDGRGGLAPRPHRSAAPVSCWLETGADLPGPLVVSPKVS